MEERHRLLLIKQNPWWSDNNSEPVKLPEFERDLLGELLAHVKYRQIIAITGLRRVGKTVLMKQIIRKLVDVPKNNICYLPFDDIDFQKYTIAEDLINYFLEFSDKSRTRYLFLDELQKLPNWADLLKTVYDLNEESLKIFVSGSSSLELKEQKETLAGRILTFHVPVFTFSEFARFFGMMEHEMPAKQDILREYDLKFAGKTEKYADLFRDYLVKGAFPELLGVSDEEFIKKYIRESVIEKSIVDVARIAKEDEKVVYELFRLLAGSNARLFEITNLSSILKIDRNRISRCIGLLEKSFLIKVAHNFTTSIAKQARSGKKQYLAHSSIVIALLDYPFSVVDTEIAGHLVESEIANSVENSAFWRTPQKDEVDVVTKGSIPIEVKYRSQITTSDVKSVLKFCKSFNAGNAVIVTKNLLEKRKVGDVDLLLVPAWLFLLLGDSFFEK